MATLVQNGAGRSRLERAPALPLVRPLPLDFTPEFCFRKLAKLPGCVWLDSSQQFADKDLGRFSYMAVDPFCRLRVDKAQPGSLLNLAELTTQFAQPKLKDLPPFQGGWLGWFGYEFGRCFEQVPAAQHNEFHLPLATLGLYDVVLCWDHARNEGWVISQGWPALQQNRRQRHAYKRLKWMLQRLEIEPGESCNTPANALSANRLAKQYSTRWPGDSWTSNLSPQAFQDAVARCVDYIHDGDVFQVNLSQRLLTRAKCNSAELYLHLRKVSPAPFSGYADFGRVQVVSSSPERFLNVSDKQVESRPIKGTRPRLSDPLADAGIGDLLQASEKDRSENVMIVDLMRNDLARVSENDSIKVPSLCGLEKYPFVWHLVSVIKSRLREDCTAVDLIGATFPGGSITGAPKIRAMEIISEVEPTVRGPYCGSLGYISFAGDMDLNILIRTITACDGWWQVPVGGGIVADSDPQLEEQETWHKAEGMLRAIESLET